MSDASGRLSAALADRYRDERELGQGGVATVYLAQDVRHDRKVAITSRARPSGRSWNQRLETYG